ncbi:MAG: tripartite tricarboxylate transporter TctB family protein [Clostridia bacterium]|nr:tripartite tricarboxylate transporter TctB family protein [Clostridia bacterium]
MDPIKVDFSGRGGADKSREIVIPPEKAVLKIILSVVFALLTGAVVYYFMLPPINLKAIEFYYFLGIVIASFVVFLALLSGVFKHSEYVPYVKKRSVVPAILIGVLAVTALVGYLVGCQFFRAKSYYRIMDVDKDRVFSEDIGEPNFDTVPKLDEAATNRIAQRSLSELAKQNKVSQFKIYNGTAASTNYPQINYQGRPMRLAMLNYGDVFKWIGNVKNGLPGYILVDTANEKREFCELEEPIRYSLSDHFGRHVKRVVRFAYPTYMFDNPSVEIDDDGRPFWIVPRLDKTIGMFGGRDVVGIVLVNAVTGECTYHTMDEVRNSKSLQWIDRVYADDLILEQFKYYGLYEKGFWNALVFWTGCVKSTDGCNYIALDDDVWLYTGVTSLRSDDESIAAFVLVNQRTKETRYYDGISGSTEIAAANAAKERASEKVGYTPSFPLLLNIGGSPTYFLVIKDKEETVQLYGMVNVEEYNSVKVVGSTISECLDNYLTAMKNAKIPFDRSSAENIIVPDEINTDDTPAAEPQGDSDSAMTGRVTEIRSAVIDGNTTYYLRLDGDSAYYAVSAAESEQAVILNVGDTIRASVSGSGLIRNLKNLEIVPA